MFPSLGRMTLCSSCPVGAIRTVSLIIWARCSRSALCVGCVCPSVVAVSWLQVACQWMGLTLRLTVCMDLPWPQHRSCCVGLTRWSRIHLSKIWWLPWPPFRCAACGASWVVFCCHLMLVTGCVGCGASWDSLRYRSMSEAAWEWPGAPC